jgi:hypothetical protein
MRASHLLIALTTSVEAYVPNVWAACTDGLRLSRPVTISRSVVVRACAGEQLDASDVSSLYASLRDRRSQLTSRYDVTVQERELVQALADVWPKHERAQLSLWQHWFSEEGEAAAKVLHAGDGDALALSELMDKYPDWAEPVNRLATLRYMEGNFAESVQLCLRVLRQKPWHFGASSGIVMCYTQLGDATEASRWSSEAMPPLGPQRSEWVQRMLKLIDAKLEELDGL